MKPVIKMLPLSLALAGLAAPSLFAAELEQVIVTSQKRTESLQEVPAAVTAITSAAIQEGGVTGIADIAAKAPGFNFSQFNIGEPQLYLRGIGSSNDSAAADAPVAVFLDDVYIGRAGGASFDLYDIERVEVLRGPQGTLFGKNVVGGALSVITTRPSRDFEAKVGASFGNLNLRTFKGYVTGPLTDNLAGKVSLMTRTRDGYASNAITGEKYQDQDNMSGRAQTLFTPRNDLQILLGIDASHDTDNGNCRVAGNLGKDTRSLAVRTLLQNTWDKYTGGDKRKCFTDQNTYEERHIYGSLLKVDWDVASDMSFTSVTGWRASNYTWADDLGGAKFGTVPFSLLDRADEKADQVSQELRLSGGDEGKLDWVTGAFFMRERVNRNERFIGAFVPASTRDGDVAFAQSVTTLSDAVFGHVKWRFIEDWSLSLGGRYSYDKKGVYQGGFNYETNGTAPGIPMQSPYSVTASKSWSEFTPSASLDYQVSDNGFIYATISKGYKSGAYPSQASAGSTATVPLDPETVWNYELGAKTEWLDNRLRVNVATFYMKYSDLQIFALSPTLLLVASNGNATSKGMDVEVQAALTDNLYLSGSYSYLRTEYTKYLEAGVDRSGNLLARAPRNSYSLDLNYDQTLGSLGKLGFGGGYDWKGAFYFDPSNDPVVEERAHGLLGAHVAYTAPGDKLTVTLWGKNLQDTLYRVHAIRSSTAGSTDVFGEPRTYGATVEYKY